MSELRSILGDTVERLARDLSSAPGFDPAAETWPAEAWGRVEELGLSQLLAPEAEGGIGGTWEDAFVILRAVGYYCLPLPVGETMLARALLAGTGLAEGCGMLGLSVRTLGEIRGRTFSGTLARVPWGRHLDRVAAVTEAGQAIVLPLAAAASVMPGRNLAGEPRDTLVFADVPVEFVPAGTAEARALLAHGALLRVAAAAGTFARLLDLSVQQAKDRQQFGRPIGNFQAIQQQLAVLAGEAAVVACTARAACRAAALGDAGFEIAAAKLRCNRAIDIGAGIAHQVHGAIGFTQEHALRHVTQRLWSWRTEFGSDRHWADLLGGDVARRGGAAFWPDLTARADRAVGLAAG